MLESKGVCRRTRAWRRRQRTRMIAKAWRIAKERYPCSEGISVVGHWRPWRDIKGQWRKGPVAWDDVFALRAEDSARNEMAEYFGP